MEQQRSELASDVRDIFAEAKRSGFDVRAIRQIIRIHGQDQPERQARQELVAEYLSVCGDFRTTALGQATIVRASGGLMPKRRWPGCR